ncbi:bifunctional precorrin-2 dehydrogenase/sirohydrochlorin ferrochelatase [Paenibacillus sp. LHD-38]|uniref:precorrin-2 dehydrogenase/sirohydrochlorin ferrochelatase family protein n=1 Tax=Paenibacillus sp. LHD-38 TaxID=3072143 RepID=UPI00280C7A2C|nr:bifunctional precorrin-2 dehydrogenase/sirohydrochlorin ferrochelatase [Paenibacillus sp. LHD-38]MDQ8737417.1 bifunctional precorrin-2 dehydrogenase/sirohydrochlorin ferrochelatase [Paenibacillus sp. LHD-38]
MNGFYPVVMQLRGRRCVVIGGGGIAERKLLGLLDAGADDVRVISPLLTPKMAELAAEGKISSCQREYVDGDLSGAWLVFAATNDKRVNAVIAAAAERLGILVNSADEASNGSFISPSTLRRGDLLLSVTASGASPALSQRIKKELAVQYGLEYEEITAQLRRLRETVLSKGMDEQQRQAVLKLAAEEAMQHKRYNRDIEEWLQSLLHRIDRGLT